MLMIDNEPEKKSFGVISITRVTVRCVGRHALQPPRVPLPESRRAEHPHFRPALSPGRGALPDLPEGVGRRRRAPGRIQPRGEPTARAGAGRRSRPVAGAEIGPCGGVRFEPAARRRFGLLRGGAWARGGGAVWVRTGAGCAWGSDSGRRRVQPAAVVARRASWLRRRPGKAVTLALTLAAQRSEQKRRDRLVLASMNTPWQAAPAQVPSRSGPI